MLFSCQTVKYKDFSLRNSSWQNTGILITNGYYYCDLSKATGYSSEFKNKEKKYDIFLLYKDGLCCYLGDLFKTLDEAELYMKTYRHSLGIDNKNAKWGRYIVNKDSSFYLEFFFKDFASINSLGIFRNYGTVYKNSSFSIHKSYMVGFEPPSKSTTVYTFVPFTPKPDSTNWMMKKRWFRR